MGAGDFSLSRRSLLKITGAGLASIYLGGCSSFTPASDRDVAGGGAAEIYPIDRTLGDIAPKRFSGDVFERPHALLWDTVNYVQSKGGLPTPTEKAPVVIIGGGMSGLMSAYLLREHNPLVLEQAPRLGGNARAEVWQGLEYALGAAYFLEPEEGTPLRTMMNEIGVHCPAKETSDPIVFEGKKYAKFWEGESDPSQSSAFKKYQKYLHDVFNGKNGRRYPDLPFESDWIKKLDEISLVDKLQKDLGPLHPHILSAVDRYCWTSFNGKGDEISAAAGLNFLAAEAGKVWVAPGGNAAVAEALAKKLPADRLRTGAVVFQVTQASDKVVVSYEDAEGKFRAVEAGAVVMACPKFVAKKLLPQIEAERVEAIDRVKYRSFLVANVMLKKSVRPLFYDLFFLGKAPAEQAGVVDTVLADFARPEAKQSVLTLYKAMPYDGARGQIYAPDSYARYRAEFEQTIAKEVMPVLGLNASDIVDIRLTRWGHPIPVAEKGRIADGTVAALRKPFRDRVFFVEQDNWLLPALETAANEAFHFAPQVASLIKSSFV